MGATCAVECPGNYEWKKLYNQSRAEERALIDACTADKDPTKNWKPVQPGLKYAIAFSGRLRHMIATYHTWVANVVEPTGTDLVHFYFHVW
jgi:hypothetical protein